MLLPVLILTANDMEMDEVMGLTLGADDYMTKPFSLAVLRARIQVLLRRGKSQNTDVYEEDDFRFDFGRLIFTRDGREIALSVNEQRLLKLFTENRGRVLTRAVLFFCENDTAAEVRMRAINFSHKRNTTLLRRISREC